MVIFWLRAFVQLLSLEGLRVTRPAPLIIGRGPNKREALSAGSPEGRLDPSSAVRRPPVPVSFQQATSHQQ